MSMIERTRVKCDSRGCEKRTYVPARSDQQQAIRSCLNDKGWALIEVGKLRRALCPEHVAVAEATSAVKFVPKPLPVNTSTSPSCLFTPITTTTGTLR